MAVRRVLFCRQHNGKFRTLARLRNHFDIAALPRYDLAGQIQANAHTLLFVYFFLTIEALEDSGLIAFGMPLPVSVTLISTYISHSTTDTAIFPPAGVYFTALSSRLKRASDVHLLS